MFLTSKIVNNNKCNQSMMGWQSYDVVNIDYLRYKRDNVLLITTKWVTLMITVLSKVNKTQGHMWDIVSLVCGKEPASLRKRTDCSRVVWRKGRKNWELQSTQLGRRESNSTAQKGNCWWKRVWQLKTGSTESLQHEYD